VCGIAVFYFNIILHGIGLGLGTKGTYAANFFLVNNIQGPIFNNFDIGSYLDYRFYPQQKVFVDGRPEAYPPEFFQKMYIPMQESGKNFETIDKIYHFNSIFYLYTEQTPWGQDFLKDTIENPMWKPVYLDENMVILVKNNTTNSSIIKKFTITKDNIVPEKLLHSQRIDDATNLLYFLDSVGWDKAEIALIQQLLPQQPNNCLLLSQIGKAFYQEKNYSIANIYASKYQSLCE
jgi:hypothetical protein